MGSTRARHQPRRGDGDVVVSSSRTERAILVLQALASVALVILTIFGFIQTRQMNSFQQSLLDAQQRIFVAEHRPFLTFSKSIAPDYRSESIAIGNYGTPVTGFGCTTLTYLVIFRVEPKGEDSVTLLPLGGYFEDTPTYIDLASGTGQLAVLKGASKKHNVDLIQKLRDEVQPFAKPRLVVMAVRTYFFVHYVDQLGQRHDEEVYSVDRAQQLNEKGTHALVTFVQTFGSNERVILGKTKPSDVWALAQRHWNNGRSVPP
jgi:hypothetical protein